MYAIFLLLASNQLVTTNTNNLFVSRPNSNFIKNRYYFMERVVFELEDSKNVDKFQIFSLLDR